MTYQRDPNRDRTGRRPQDSIRHDGGSWSPVALLSPLLLLLIGWFILSDRTAGPGTTTGVSTPSTNTGGASKTPQEKK